MVLKTFDTRKIKKLLDVQNTVFNNRSTYYSSVFQVAFQQFYARIDYSTHHHRMISIWNLWYIYCYEANDQTDNRGQCNFPAGPSLGNAFDANQNAMRIQREGDLLSILQWNFPMKDYGLFPSARGGQMRSQWVTKINSMFRALSFANAEFHSRQFQKFPQFLNRLELRFCY